VAATSGWPLVQPADGELMGGWSTVKTGDTVMRRIRTFLLTRDRIYDGGPIRLYYNIGKVIPLQARCSLEGGYMYSSTVP